MRFSHLKKPLTVVLGLVAVSACDQAVTSPEPEIAPAFAKATGPDVETLDQIVAFVDGVNAQFAAAGQTIRLDYPWLFTVGGGTDPYQRLRTGSRWTTLTPEYILDVADFGPSGLSTAEAEAAFVSAYSTWNAVPQSHLAATRGADPTGNVDVLDGLYDAAGNCVFLYDLTSPNLDINAGTIDPASDIVVGGFPPATYFSQCLGSASIIGVTWTFSDVDTNGDQYRDRLYVEQYYNPAFEWTTTDAVYLDFDAPFDLETIALHENGHAHGLGHFGGPLARQPFTLKPNGRVFNPEAVMNPYYLGGEDHALYPTDQAALLTMYTGLH